MKVSKFQWLSAMTNLIERRKSGRSSSSGGYNPIGDYKRHISKIKIGKSVLDVGCGSMAIRPMLPPGVSYTGIDAFPVNDEVVKMEIEECSYNDNSFDTVICFAAMDGMYDLERAIYHMKRVCAKNILILTGINIEPDKFHTLKITETYLNESMKDFRVGHKEYFGDKVILIEYRK